MKPKLPADKQKAPTTVGSGDLVRLLDYTQKLMKPKTIKINTEKIIEESGPIMPIEVAKEIWMQLHKTRNSTTSNPAYALEKDEEELYHYITKRLVMQAAIVGVKITEAA